MDGPYRGTPLFERGLELLGFDPFDALEQGTRAQQPALFLCSVASYDALPEGERDDAIAAAGHSLGEYAALVAADALQFDDAVRLVDERASAMAEAAEREPGGMVAMLGERADVEALTDAHGLTVANDNAPGQLVLAGPVAGLDAAEEQAREVGARARRLPVSGAFHSSLMAPAAERLAAALERTPVQEPRIPVLSNGSAEPFTDIRRELAENLLRPVRFREIILALHGLGAQEYRELGPGAVLAGLVKRTLREVPAG